MIVIKQTMKYPRLSKEDIEAELFQTKFLQELDDKYVPTFNFNYIKKIRRMLSERREYTYRNMGSKILVVYPHDYFVKSHFLYYKNFIDYFSHFDAFYYSSKEDGRRGGIISDWIWLISIMKEQSLKINLAYTVSLLPTFFDYWKNVEIKDYNLVVLYNELSPISSYIVHKCRQCGVKTATLQHGQMLGINPDKPGWIGAGHMLKDSKVDYFLGWNQFTAEEAVRSGMSPTKFIIAGMPGYLGKKIQIPRIYNRRMGVILHSDDNLNISVLGITKEYSKRFDYKYYVRFRPGVDRSRYEKYLDNNYIETSESETVEDFARKVEFSICAPTSCYDELLLMNSEVYRLKCDKDVYSSFIYGTVEDVDDLIEAREHWDEIKNRCSDYIGRPVDSEKRYEEFFSVFENIGG